MPYFVEPKEVIDYFYNRINDNKAALGVRFVGYEDERILPQYPAVVVSLSVPLDRSLHATRTFNLEWQVAIIVHHARITASHKTRTQEDMDIATAVRNKLHEDYTAGGGVIFGYVRSERPGVVANEKGQAVVSTLLTWTGTSRAAF